MKGESHETFYVQACQLWSFFDVALLSACSHSLSVRLLKEKNGEEILSSVNYSFFIFSFLDLREKAHMLDKMLCDQRFEKCA